MSPPAGPIYASTLHRRDRAWRARRRGVVRARARAVVMGGAITAMTTVLIQHFV